MTLAAAFLTGRATSPKPAEIHRELAQLRNELTREITDNLRATHQHDLTELAAATVQASTAGQRELVTSLAANFNVAIDAVRRSDRREFLTVIEKFDRRRAEESAAMRDSFQVLAEKTGGAFRETDTRLNALASALPAQNSGPQELDPTP